MARFNWFDFRMDLQAIVGREVSHAEAQSVRRDIKRHHTLQERFCNGFQTYSGSEDSAARKRAESREKGVQRRLADFFGAQLAEFTGDPRGCTVKLRKYEKGNPAYDSMVEKYGNPRKFTHFEHDWGGNLICLL